MTELRFKVAPVWKGNYNNNITYDISDEVSFTSDMVEEITENTPTFGYYRSLIKNNTSPLNDTSAWSLILDLSRIEAATREGEETNEILKSNEAIRVDNENNRIEQENIRKNSELQRAINENNRKSAETNRIDAEANRKSSENSRKDNEISRNSAENQRINAENTRILNEDTRQSNETTRSNNETSRISSENTRKTNENTRISNELTRQQNETTRLLQEGSSSDSPNPTGSRWARYKLAESDRDTIFNNSQQNRANTFTQSQTDRQTSYNQAEGTPEDEPDAGGSRWARYLKAESDRDVAILEIKEDYAKKEDLENGNIVPAMAETLAPWADQKAIATPDTYSDAVRTTGGDIPIETSADSKLESIKPVAGSKWTAKMLFNGSYNMLNAAKWGDDNSQLYVGGVGGDFVYFLVPELILGTFGTTDENNGLLFTDSEGENVEPTSVYFKPLGATVPQSLTDGTSISPTSVSYDGNTYKTYETSGAGWLIVPKTIYDSDVCAHIAWEDWYDKYVSLDEPNTNPEAVVGVLILEGLLALAHSDKYLRGINEEVCDNAVFGDTSSTITYMVDELSVAANAWTNAATGESDSQGNTLYRHSATVSGIKQGGAACIEGEDGGIPLTVNGTTVSYIDTNAAASASVVFYEVTATSTTKAYTDNVFSGSNINTETGVLPINDCSIEAQVAMDGEANITVKYAKNIVDQVAINATVDVPQIKEQIEEHEERIEELEDTAVRTGSYDANVSVGRADNLTGEPLPVTTGYTLKATGYDPSQPLLEFADGQVNMTEIQGRACAWNQLVENGDFSNGTTGSRGNNATLSVNNGICTVTKTGSTFPGIRPYAKILKDHKYYVRCWVNTPGGINLGTNAQMFYTSVIPAGTVGYWRTVATATRDSQEFAFSMTSGESYDITDIQAFDLTLLNPTLAAKANLTVAEVEEYLATIRTPKPYYAYNAGTLLGAKMLGWQLTKAANLLNPTTKQAKLFSYAYTGHDNEYTVNGWDELTGAALQFTPYATGVAGAVTLDANNRFVIPSAGMLEIVADGGDITGDISRVCVVATYDGSMDDVYSAYEENNIEIDSANIYYDNNGVKTQAFDGGIMRSTGDASEDVHDRVYFDEVAKKWIAEINTKKINFGTGSWELSTTQNCFFLRNDLYGNKNINARYKTVYSTTPSNQADKTICLGYYSDGPSFVVKDTSYSSLADFKASLAGVMCYVLISPITRTDLYYKVGNDYVPMEQVFPDGIQCLCYNWASENLVEQGDDANGQPQSITPMTTEVFESDLKELLKTIGDTYVSREQAKDNFDNFISALNTNSGTALGGSYETDGFNSDGTVKFKFTANE